LFVAARSQHGRLLVASLTVLMAGLVVAHDRQDSSVRGLSMAREAASVTAAPSAAPSTSSTDPSDDSAPVPTDPHALSLQISASPDRSGSVPLDGATATGPVSVFVTTGVPPLALVFDLDGQQTRIEHRAPYDLEGTAADRSAVLLAPPDTGSVTHVVTVSAYWGDGARHQRITASFTQSPIPTDPSQLPTPGTSPSDSPTSPSPVPVDGSEPGFPTTSGLPGASPEPTGSGLPSGSGFPSASPSTSPSPSGSDGIDPTPSASGGSSPDAPPDAMPDASNTGPHGVLTPTGSLSITQPGTYSNLDVHGHIDVMVPGVVLTNIRVDASDAAYAIRNRSSGHLTITDCDLGPDGTPTHMTDAAVVYSDYTLMRCNVHGTGDGLKAHGDSVIEDNYIHDMFESGGNHSDGIQVSSGSHDIIADNTIVSAPRDSTGAIAQGTSCILVKSDQGPIDDVQIVGNSFGGDPGYMVYDRSGSSYPTPTNILIAENTFGPKETSPGAADGYIWGVISSDSPGPVTWGNVRS
jgi:hypothetical protein